MPPLSSHQTSHREAAFLNDFAQVRHELVGDRAVDQAVIERERHDANRSNADEVAIVGLDHHGTLLHSAHAENRYLRLIAVD